MIDLFCPRCSATYRVAATAFAAGAGRCPECGLAITFRVAEPEGDPVGAARPGGAAPSTEAIELDELLALRAEADRFATDFHPRSLFDEGALLAVAGAGAPGAPHPGRRAADGEATAALTVDGVEVGFGDGAGERRPPAREAFLLQVGAEAGRERLALPWACTVVGRREGDLRLADLTVSARHFQIESIGAEFYVRDLGSRNGTWLNGHRVRYAELRPGDALRAGRTDLVFRLAGDGISRGGEQA